MDSDEWPSRPSIVSRRTSAFVIGLAGVLSRSFLCGANRVETIGLDAFCDLLDRRANIANRERGLITVSNHLSVMDDPLMWGILPWRYQGLPDNMRWSLGSYDICFKNAFASKFFTVGQVLPTHRSAHSPFGGLFQPAITQAIRLLSQGPFMLDKASSKGLDREITDPFSSANLIYSTNGFDSFPNPTAYLSRRHAWIHIFPEGRIHQRHDKAMRYFKWGISRLILESEPCPDVVPIWIEGFDEIMHESRQFPRFIPRSGKTILLYFGQTIDVDQTFGDLRARWRKLREAEAGISSSGRFEVGALTDRLKYSDEAVSLRVECTDRVRYEILKLRSNRGFPEEDPKNTLAATWREEGTTKGDGKMMDDSWVRDV